MQNAKKLTLRQAAFVSEYLATGNATVSAIKANFSAKGASVAGVRMLRNASVQMALQARQAADATRLSIKRDHVLASLQEAINQARQQGNPMAMIRGWSEIAKMLGLYAAETKKVELSTAGEGTLKLVNQMSDAELVGMIEAGSR